MTFFFSFFQLIGVHDVNSIQIIDLEKPLLSKSTMIEFETIFDGLYGCTINFKEKEKEVQKENH